VLCTSCESGAFAAAGATTCITAAAAPSHSWDFRGCITGAVIVDANSTFSLNAVPMNGPTCSSEGLSFDGVDDFVELTAVGEQGDWIWGGTVSFEMQVMFNVFTVWSRIFDFGNGEFSVGCTDRVFLASTRGVDAAFNGGVRSCFFC
jgi:hypothetical protein